MKLRPLGDKVVLQPDQFSLTNEIMTQFKNGEI